MNLAVSDTTNSYNIYFKYLPPTSAQVMVREVAEELLADSD